MNNYYILVGIHIGKTIGIKKVGSHLHISEIAYIKKIEKDSYT